MSADLDHSVHANIRFATPTYSLLARVVIATMTVFVGVGSLLLLPSGALRSSGPPVIWFFAITSVLVAVVWVRLWPRRHVDAAYVAYADIALVSVLSTFEVPFDALPGCGLLAVVAMYVVVFGSTRIMLVHLAFSIVVVAGFATAAIDAGASPWLTVSRTFTLVGLFSAPFVILLYIGYLRAQVESNKRDSRTGLRNRRGLQLEIRSLLTRLPSNSTMGVVVIDVDDFSSVEQRYGVGTANGVIDDVAVALKESLPGDAVLARVGVDEFVCVAIGSPQHVDTVVATMVRAVDASTVRSAPVHLRSGTAVGGADSLPEADAVLRRLMALAEIDRSGGVGPIGQGTPTHTQIARIRSRILSLVADGGPSIVFQPVCAAADEAVVGYEALSRFPAGHGSPQAWFADARAAGVRRTLEVAAIERAVEASAALPASKFLSVNASAETIVSADLSALLRGAAARRTVLVEVTEHDLIDDYTALGDALATLRTAGIAISVDDVGAGYSGLRQLVEIEPDVVKLDASIVRGIDTDRMRRAAATSVATFAREIGAACIYEGVETVGELATARALGAEMVQGYLLGRPGPAPRTTENHVRPTPDSPRTRRPSVGDDEPPHRVANRSS